MKKIIPFLIVLSIVVIIIIVFLSLASNDKMVVVQEGNLKRLPIEMELNRYQDSDCGMVIEDLHYASQVIAQNGKTWFFHDHGGFIHWLEDKKFKDSVKIWVMSRDTKKWIDATAAFFSQTDVTPMGYGFGAYEKNDKDYIDFETMRLRMLRGETMNNPFIKQKLLAE